MLGGLYSYFFGPSDDGEYQKAEEKLKLLQTQLAEIKTEKQNRIAANKKAETNASEVEQQNEIYRDKILELEDEKFKLQEQVEGIKNAIHFQASDLEKVKSEGIQYIKELNLRQSTLDERIKESIKKSTDCLKDHMKTFDEERSKLIEDYEAELKPIRDEMEDLKSQEISKLDELTQVNKQYSELQMDFHVKKSRMNEENLVI